MKFRLPVLFIFMIAVISCKKDDDANIVPPADNFQPVSAHSSWTYSEFPGNGLFTVTMTGLDTTFDNKKYKEMYSNLSGYSYFRKENGSYFWLYPNDTTQEYLYLKDNGLVNDHWEVTYDINGFPTRYVYKTLSMNKPALVGGIVYDNVIVVKRDTYIDFGMGDSLVTTQNFSYANNVGLVLTEEGNNKIYLSHYLIQ
jgi:hypothetical protein